MDDGRKPLRNTIVLIVGLLIFWQLMYFIVGDVAMRSPWQTLRSTVKLGQTELFWLDVENTMLAFAAALAIAVVLGLLIGFALGLHRLSAEAMEPMLVALYSIPKITLYPIILLVFGLGMSAKVAFGAIHGIIPVALFTLDAVRSTRPIFVKTGRVFRLDRREMVRSILFPAAVPEIFTGLRVGFSLTLIGTVLGEMFASQHGLGHLLMNAISLYNVDVIMSVTFLLVVFAASVNAVLLAIDRRLHFGRSPLESPSPRYPQHPALLRRGRGARRRPAKHWSLLKDRRMRHARRMRGYACTTRQGAPGLARSRDSGLRPSSACRARQPTTRRCRFGPRRPSRRS